MRTLHRDMGPDSDIAPNARSRRRWSAAFVLSLLVAVAGCGIGGPAQLDVSRVSRLVTARARTNYPGVAVSRTRCPGGVEQRRGLSFSCTVTVAGAPLRVRVEQRDARGNVLIQAQQAVITKQSAEQFVMQHTSIPAMVDCGATPVFVILPGGQIPCTVTFVDSTMQKIGLRVVDTSGTISIVTPPKQ